MTQIKSLVRGKQLLLIGVIAWFYLHHQITPAMAASKDCQRDELGLWTEDKPFNLTTSVQIQVGTSLWKYFVLHFYQSGNIKRKIIFKRNKDDITVQDLSHPSKQTKIPAIMIQSKQRSTITFSDKSLEVKTAGAEDKVIKLDDVSLGDMNSFKIQLNNDENHSSKTVLNFCSSDDARMNKDESSDSCPAPPPCPEPLPPTPNPCPSAPPCPTICPSRPPYPTLMTSPAPSPSPTLVSAPSPSPTLVSAPSPSPTLVSPQTLLTTEGDSVNISRINDTLCHRHLLPQKAVLGGSYNKWIIYGLAAGSAVLCITSIALAIALCRVRKQQSKSVSGKCQETVYFTQQSQSLSWNQNVTSQMAVTDHNTGQSCGSQNQPNFNANHNADDIVSMCPTEGSSEWDSEERIYANIGAM